MSDKWKTFALNDSYQRKKERKSERIREFAVGVVEMVWSRRLKY